ncbi:hypothetical protein TBLA_0D04750 [Henningerozyma blattae CBS 6284]|uniref:BZIP domain-containing protein n=1 Tax=Henningerozyma blattae (strain ATCC 34711 / CBS 6284 / DSM 70876 / NBRC 10599 / NRRL Y-10934 / UCD 77-7) TaxID=1071380 RepID=I2H3L9_HENB6|nr:hypothetical protein TBLA_0D04750 [Tetrapisispora blattae CBS 6284]CCH60971.1 hypothetical protein TBLA_0D04750 [Tetrapisispora blattae CBS 6284]
MEQPHQYIPPPQYAPPHSAPPQHASANTTAINNGTMLSHNNTAAAPTLRLGSNPHALNDPTLQEILSPFFQPFGVDVSHLPMTNPPIFQSSVTRYNEPSRRRRISISNGQISQLGEEIETVDSLYNQQPPPMPEHVHSHAQHLVGQQQPSIVGHALGQSHTVADAAHVPQAWPQDSGVAQGMVPQSTMPQNTTAPGSSASSSSATTTTTSASVPATATATAPAHNSNTLQPTLHNAMANTVPQNTVQSSMPPAQHQFDAWKRARLLERNRIAASKCRQRKKIAQLQLQRDYDQLVGENRRLTRKLAYYEKLVLKFRHFTEEHVQNCSGSKEGLRMVEEMLRIDSGVDEVDERGLVVKMEDT